MFTEVHRNRFGLLCFSVQRLSAARTLDLGWWGSSIPWPLKTKGPAQSVFPLSVGDASALRKAERGVFIIDDTTSTPLKVWFCHRVLVGVVRGSRAPVRIRTATLTARPVPQDSFSVQRSKVSLSEQQGRARRARAGTSTPLCCKLSLRLHEGAWLGAYFCVSGSKKV